MPTVRQVTPLKEALQTGSTLTCNAWPSPVLANSRIVVFAAITNFGTDGIDVSGIAGSGATYVDADPSAGQAEAIRLNAGHAAESMRAFQALNASASAAAPTATYTGLPAGGVHVTLQAVEVTGDDPATLNDENIPPKLVTGAGSTLVAGPVGPSARDSVLYLGAFSVPNVQPIALDTNTDPWSQVAAGTSSGTGDSSKISYLLADLEQLAAGSATLDLKIPAGNTRQWAGIILAIPGPTGGGGGGSGSGSPRTIPGLGLPDTTGYTVLTDPDPTVVWTPTHPGDPANSGLRNGVDYLINCPVQRGRAIHIIGGRNRVIPLLLIKATSRDPELVRLGGGDVGSLVAGEHWHLDSNGQQCDAIKTVQPFSGRDLQIGELIIEKLIGSTDATGDPGGPTDPGWIGVHADAIQAAGGIGNVYLEDYHIMTTYQALQLQQEAKLTGSPQTATGWTRSGTSLTITKNAHGLTAGKFVSHVGFSTAEINGGYQIDSATTNTYTVTMAITPTATSGGGGTIQEMAYAYTCGSLFSNRGYIEGFTNASGDPSAALGSMRLGGRTAPVNNSHPNEDETPVTDVALPAGTVFQFTETYIKSAAGGLSNFVKPDDSSSNWSVVRAHIDTAPTPDTIGWPNWPRVTGVIKLGPPASPFVTLVDGVPTSTQSGGGGAGPAPANTTPPSILPLDPVDTDTLTIPDLGSWSNTDSSTIWTATFWKRLPPSGTPIQVAQLAGVTAAEALAFTHQLAQVTDVGQQWRVGIIADNGTPGTEAYSAWTNAVAASALVITLTVTVESDNGRAKILVESSDQDAQSLVGVTLKYPSGRVVTVRGIDKASMPSGVFLAWDYELPIGEDVTYQAIVYADAATEVARSAPVTVRWDTDQDWVKDPLNPVANMPISVVAVSDATYDTPTGVYPVLGRPEPITRGDVRQAEANTFTFLTQTKDERERFHYITASGRALLFQSSQESGYGNMYFQPLQTKETRPSSLRSEPARLWVVQFQECSAPVGQAAPTITWADVAASFTNPADATWENLAAIYPTWLDLAANFGESAGPTLTWRGA